MQRDGNSDDRTKAGASGRTPPVIEGEAVDVSPVAANATSASEAEAALHDDVARVEDADAAEAIRAEEAEEAEEAVAPADPIAAPPGKKTRGGAFAILGILLVACAGAVAWIATPGQNRPSDGSLKSRVIAMLPESAQRALHVPGAGAPAADTQPAETAKAPAAETSPAAPSSATKTETPAPAATASSKTEAAKPEEPKSEAPKAEEPKLEAPKSSAVETMPAETKPAEPAAGKPAVGDTGSAASSAAPAPAAPQSGMTMVGGPPVAIGVDPKRIEDMAVKIDGLQANVDSLQGKLDGALGRIAELQTRLDLAQGKIDLTQTKAEAATAAAAMTQAAQRIETLTQKLAAIEQKLEQPKTDTRAPQARENTNAPSGRELAASRAVVAQATAEALRAGAPLGDDLAALKGLGVVDDKIADLAAYAKTGAPTVAQLTQQWRGLREKVVALEAPAPGASFTDKFIAKAKGVFHVTWAGQGTQNSIGSAAARVDAALAKNDLAGAVAACGDFPAVAKNLVADWQTAASARLKADAAARALLSESISAIGRSSQ